jgi:TPR repeat protein
LCAFSLRSGILIQDGGRRDTIDSTDENHPSARINKPVVRLDPVLRAFHNLPPQLNQTMKTIVALSIAALTIAGIARADEPAELESLRSRAGGGDVKAQLDLAIRYRDGKGVAKDEAEAMQWAHRAADKGHAEALDFVGHAYLRGAVVKRSPEIAFGYFKAAAEKSAQAAFNLGQCYFGAQGTEQDISTALDWWKKAAAKGHGRAASTAAMAFLTGEGVAPDVADARRLAGRAAELNDPSGLVLLGELQFQAGDLDGAKANWTKVSKLHPTGPTGHPAQPSDSASAQQGADLLKLIEYRQRQGEPGKFAFVQMPHIHQGYNNCGSTACATFARFQGAKLGGWDFKRLCPSPLGTGTDWGHLLEASKKIGLKWKLVTFTPDAEGFDKATTFLKNELDAERPVVIDFKYIGPQYPGGEAGHTLAVTGYLAEENLYILCNPAIATPGLQLITAADLKDFWRSDHYGALSKGVLSRPAIVIEQP